MTQTDHDELADTIDEQLALDRLVQSRTEFHRMAGREAGERWALDRAQWPELEAIRDTKADAGEIAAHGLARASQARCLRLLADIDEPIPAGMVGSGPFAEGFIFAADQVRERVELLVDAHDRAADFEISEADAEPAKPWWEDRVRAPDSAEHGELVSESHHG